MPGVSFHMPRLVSMEFVGFLLNSERPFSDYLGFPFLMSEINTGLELKKNSKSPFGDYRRKNGRQMQKCSRQIVQEQKLKLEPHLIGIVFRLPVICVPPCYLFPRTLGTSAVCSPSPPYSLTQCYEFPLRKPT